MSLFDIHAVNMLLVITMSDGTTIAQADGSRWGDEKCSSM